jgi:hypothetical protein
LEKIGKERRKERKERKEGSLFSPFSFLVWKEMSETEPKKR